MSKLNFVGRPAVYPWTDWLTIGTEHVLRQGIDFQCSATSLAQYVYKKAIKLGLRVKVSQKPDGRVELKTVGRRKKVA